MNKREKTMPGGGRVFPASRAGWLASSLRKLWQNPDAILDGLVHTGDTVVDIGCGPGFFTLPLARMTGQEGCVIAVDLQEEMLRMMHQRAERAGLAKHIRRHQCLAGTIGLAIQADFILAFHIAHETPDVAAFLREIHGMLRPGARLLLSEPRFHVTKEAFQRTLALAVEAGMRIASIPRIRLSRSAVLVRD